MPDSSHGLVANTAEKLAAFDGAFADWARLEQELSGLDPFIVGWCKHADSWPSSKRELAKSIWNWWGGQSGEEPDKAVFIDLVAPLMRRWSTVHPLMDKAHAHGQDVAELWEWSARFRGAQPPEPSEVLQLQRPAWRSRPEMRLVVRPAVEDLLEGGTMAPSEAPAIWSHVSKTATLFDFHDDFNGLVEDTPLLARLARATAPTAYTTEDYEAAIADLDGPTESLVSALQRLATLYATHGSALGDLYYWLYLGSAARDRHRYHDPLGPVVQAAELVADLDANGELEPDERGGELVVALSLAHTDRQLRGLTFELRRWARTGVRSEVLDRLLGRPYPP